MKSFLTWYLSRADDNLETNLLFTVIWFLVISFVGTMVYSLGGYLSLGLVSLATLVLFYFTTWKPYREYCTSNGK